MFRGGQANPYDDIVAKTTDENLTSENWELILNLCDKVQDEGQTGARNVIAALLKRLAHRNPNVQLYTLALAEALSKNCGVELHRELASRAFTQGLERVITDRMTHDKVKKRALNLIAIWTAEFESDPTLGIMEECYNNLKSKGFKFEAPSEPPPPAVDDEIRRREEEELQRVLEMSMQDKGGRPQWAQYSNVASGSGSSMPSGSGTANSAAAPPGRTSSYRATPAGASLGHDVDRRSSVPGATYAPPEARAGYVPARTPSPEAQPTPIPVQPPATESVSTAGSAAGNTSPVPTTQTTGAVVTRVRALHTFEPSEPGELGFEKGDIIKVVDRGYRDWWRGQLKGRTGIFPVNYVEPLPEPTPEELAKEAEAEYKVFKEAANVDRLLTMLRALDPQKDNLADNEEIQELYRSSMALRPKIVKLIDKYNQKRADLVSMNDSFMRARTIFDQMMEESLARHSMAYDPRGGYHAPYSPRAESTRPHSVAAQPQPQQYGWNPAVYDQPGYNAYPAAPSAYGQGTTYQPQPGAPAQQAYHAGPPDVQYQAGSYPVQPGPGGETYQQMYGQHNQQPQQQPPQQQQTGQPGAYPPQPYGQPGPQATPQQSQVAPPDAQPQHPGPSQYHATPTQPQQAQVQPQPQSTPQAQVQPQPAQAPLPGPPYAYDPSAPYPDPNVQAWASYYAQGGKDPTGAVYFISVPGVKEAVQQAGPQEPQQQSQPHAQPDASVQPVASTPVQTQPSTRSEVVQPDQPQAANVIGVSSPSTGPISPDLTPAHAQWPQTQPHYAGAYAPSAHHQTSTDSTGSLNSEQGAAWQAINQQLAGMGLHGAQGPASPTNTVESGLR